MAADTSYQPKVYRKQGGDELHVASAGLIIFEDNGLLEFGDDADITVKWDGTDLHVASLAAASTINFGAESKLIHISEWGDLTGYNREADATGYTLTGVKSRAAGATCLDNDVALALIGKGYNDNATPALKTFGSIELMLTDATDTTEDGAIVFKTMVAGAALAEKLRIADVITTSAAITLGNGTLDVDLKLFGSAAGNFLTWDASGNDLVMTGDHMELKTATADKTVRINSRDFAETAGDIIGFQSKPNAMTTGTATVYGSQISPRFAHGAGGADLVGVQSNPILKGTAAAGGDLTGGVRAFEARLEDEDGGVRTVAGTIAGIEFHNYLRSTKTVTGGVYPVNVLTHGNTLAWSGFAKLPADGNIAKYSAGHYATLGAIDGAIQVTIDGHALWVPAYVSIAA